MLEFSAVIGEVRRRHGRDLARLHRKALGHEGSDEAMRRRRVPPSFAGRSVLDRDIEVRLLASHVPLDVTYMKGSYPDGAVLLATSVRGVHARTGSQMPLDDIEADAWGLSLTPVGFEEYGLRLGTSTRFATGVIHYNCVLDASGTVCAIAPADQEQLRAGLR